MPGFGTTDAATSDHLTHVGPVPDTYNTEERQRARIAVAHNAHDADDLKHLLQTLGLIGDNE